MLGLLMTAGQAPLTSRDALLHHTAYADPRLTRACCQ